MSTEDRETRPRSRDKCLCGHTRREHQDGWAMGAQWCCACDRNDGDEGEPGACSKFCGVAEARKALFDFIGCALRGGHTFGNDHVCLRCGAHRGGASLLDLLAKRDRDKLS